MSTDPTRRDLLKSLLAGSAVLSTSAVHASVLPNWLDASAPKIFPGTIIGATSAVGHKLRNSISHAPASTRKTNIVIVGGGISGLTAAWRLQQLGMREVTLLDLEAHTGGNAHSGANPVSAYPWGAHYLPVPDKHMTVLRDFLEELGVITGYDSQGNATYNELYLCQAPQERLKMHGRWQEGIVPQTGISDEDKRQYQDFFGQMNQFRLATGSDGKKAFTIPLDWSSRDAHFRGLDNISMAAYCDQHGWDSAALRWYINYCCRDDYGAGMDVVSAWAGIHYFAARSSRDNDEHPILTWPEGNGWLAAQLRAQLKNEILTSSLVVSITKQPTGFHVDYLDVASNTILRLQARQVIYAAPRFTATYVLRDQSLTTTVAKQLHYAPWVVANITLRRPDTHQPGKAPWEEYWDNVNYDSKSLGYVVATHQTLKQHLDATVLTWYQPLDQLAPVESRKAALVKTHAQWCNDVAADLERMHPGISPYIDNIDVCVWGHGMITPVTGFLWGEARASMLRPEPGLHFAHSDMSGISIFEEAFYRGIAAADAAHTHHATLRHA